MYTTEYASHGLDAMRYALHGFTFKPTLTRRQRLHNWACAHPETVAAMACGVIFVATIAACIAYTLNQ